MSFDRYCAMCELNGRYTSFRSWWAVYKHIFVVHFPLRKISIGE